MPDDTECCGDNHVGPFQVRATDGRVIAECERREDAVLLTRLLNIAPTVLNVAELGPALADTNAELLAACKALPLDCEFEDAADYKDNAAKFDRAMRLARAAIAKAEGGAS